MKQLKRGSRGKDVEALQERLNKLGASPRLKVDGDFGPLTQKAVVAFQKSAKVKPADGAVNKYTSAALKMGGPLPVMTVKDMAGATKIAKDFQKHNLLLNGYMMALDGATWKVDSILDKELPKATKMVADNKPLWEELIKIADKIADNQKTFDAIRLSDPKKAGELADDCEYLYDDLTDIGDDLCDNIDSLYDTLDDTIKNLTKGVADIRSMMGKLKTHAKKGDKFY